MTRLVSILIPAFNAEKTVAQAIESALRQTWPSKEIIVVDDGSSDQTSAIVRQFASASVKLVVQSNEGASSARNKAYSICQGDYIQWLDADDILSTDKIEKQMTALGEGESDRTLLSSSWGHFSRSTDQARFVPTALWSDLSPVEWLIRKLGNDLYMQPATWLVSRKLSDIAGPWDVRLSLDDDGEYFCRVVRNSDRIRFVPEARMFYRRSLNTLSDVDYSDRKLESQHLALRLQVDNLLSLENSARTRDASLNFLQTYALYFYPERADLIAELQTLAGSLGGHLNKPQLPWKYAWIQKLFGWSAAKRAQRGYNRLKFSVIRAVEHDSRASSPPEVARQHGS